MCKKMFAAIIFICMGAAIVDSAPSSLRSPCPTLFRYLETDKPGLLKSSLVLLSHTDLNGLWVRVIFDRPIKGLTVSDKSFQVDLDGPEVLIKNRRYHLRPNEEKSLEFTIQYEGSVVPELVEYRVNARTLCSAQNNKFSTFYNADFTGQNSVLQTVYNRTKFDEKSLTQNCGRAKLDSKKRGSVETGQIPWMTSIYHQVSDKQSFLCEATLISDSVVITAAHCLTWENTEKPIGLEYFRVYLGLSSGDSYYNVKEVLVHPGYSSKSLSNDIALIKLETAVKFDENTSPICVPLIGSKKNDDLVVGFGFKENKKEPGTLQIAKLLLNSEEECKKRDSGLIILDNELCASYDQQNEVCVGSSGSGVFSPPDQSNPLWQLRGIISLGRALQEKYSCNRDSVVLISDVTNYLKWIRSSLQQFPQ